MNKKIIITIIFIITAVIVVEKYIRETNYEKILSAITLNEAKNMIHKEEGWFLVITSTWATGTDYLINFGDDLGLDVELIGNEPRQHLNRQRFYGAKKNRFLIKGEKIDGILDDNFEGSPQIAPYHIDVKEWYIIAPILRDYQYEVIKEKRRFFYPKNYIDYFDLMAQDYNQR